MTLPELVPPAGSYVLVPPHVEVPKERRAGLDVAVADGPEGLRPVLHLAGSRQSKATRLGGAVDDVLQTALFGTSSTGGHPQFTWGEQRHGLFAPGPKGYVSVGVLDRTRLRTEDEGEDYAVTLGGLVVGDLTRCRVEWRWTSSDGSPGLRARAPGSTNEPIPGGWKGNLRRWRNTGRAPYFEGRPGWVGTQLRGTRLEVHDDDGALVGRVHHARAFHGKWAALELVGDAAWATATILLALYADVTPTSWGSV